MRVQVVFPDVGDALLEGTGPQVDGTRTGADGHAQVIVDQRQALELAHYGGQLHAVRLQELAACGHVEEEVAHHDVGAGGAYGRFLYLLVAAAVYDTSAERLAAPASLQLHLGDGAYRGERLATETHGVEGKEVVGAGNLGCGVALEGHARVVVAHALAVVHHLNEGASGVLYHNLYLGGAGVHGVLHQLLEGGGGALHHLAGGNLVCDRVRKLSYDVNHTNRI